ncbi:unnamed protein product [Orchesella dallaii]|uniref:Uncharacterized protein n=1 Tax=Orchesella dallaii TaxID=48710 RepID=A0ABP1Q1W6_9HEXA
MFQVTGHAVYLTMAFYSYPYIQRWLPVHWLSGPEFYLPFDPQTIYTVFQHIMPSMNVPPNSKIITDMVNGIHLMMTVMHVIHETYDTHFLSFYPPTNFPGNLNGLCPPMQVNEIQTLFDFMRKNWLEIPLDSIWEPERFMGKVILERGLEADVVMPIENDLWDYSLDELKLTEDHLKNSIAAVGYTVEKARQNWIGSTNPNPHVKWWGEGSNEGSQIRFSLFGYEYNFLSAARFYEHPGAARFGHWERFLRRSLPNYILFPFSLFNEPHVSETL